MILFFIFGVLLYMLPMTLWCITFYYALHVIILTRTMYLHSHNFITQKNFFSHNTPCMACAQFYIIPLPI